MSAFLQLKLVALCSAALATAFISHAHGQADLDDWDGDYDREAERRSDVLLGAGGGLWLGSFGGFLNEGRILENPAYRRSTEFGLGSTTSAWVGVAFTDTFSFALGGGGGSLSGSGGTAAGAMGFLRLEAFPLFYEGGIWQDLGLSATFGLGGYNVEEEGEVVAEGGALSILGGGVFWEVGQLGGFTAGPSVDYLHLFSQSLSANAVSIGARAAFYGGP